MSSSRLKVYSKKLPSSLPWKVTLSPLCFLRVRHTFACGHNALWATLGCGTHRGCSPPVGHLPSPFMAFLRVWASSAALKPEVALTVPPLAAWCTKKDRKMWPRGAFLPARWQLAQQMFVEYPPGARHLSRGRDTAATGRDEALVPLRLMFKCSQRQTVKKPINKYSTRQSEVKRATGQREVMRGSPEEWHSGWGLIDRKQLTMQRSGGKCCRQR